MVLVMGVGSYTRCGSKKLYRNVGYMILMMNVIRLWLPCLTHKLLLSLVSNEFMK